MNVRCLSSNADRLKGSEAADTRPLVVLERVVGAVDVPSAFAVVSVWTTGIGVLSTVGSAKRSCPEAAPSSPKRSSISTLAFFLCTIYCSTVNLWFLFLFLFLFLFFFAQKNYAPTDVKWMARLPESDGPQGKRLRLLTECFKNKLAIVFSLELICFEF